MGVTDLASLVLLVVGSGIVVTLELVCIITHMSINGKNPWFRALFL
jgi:hypothetical protein